METLGNNPENALIFRSLHGQTKGFENSPDFLSFLYYLSLLLFLLLFCFWNIPLMCSFLQLYSWVVCYACYITVSQSQHWFCPIGYRAWGSEGQQCWFLWTSDCFWVCSYIEQIIKQITSICSDYKTFKHILNWKKTIHELCCEINGNNSWFLSYFIPLSPLKTMQSRRSGLIHFLTCHILLLVSWDVYL